MALRTIPFGYKVHLGKTVVDNMEADTVLEVFQLYINGETLDKIAASLTERQIIYFDGEVRWNKGIISRMLDNLKYKGDCNYPSIITSELYDAAAEKRKGKSCKQIKQSPVIEKIKTICFCGKCGARYKRINTWGNREKWMCSGGCSCRKYIDDRFLQQHIINVINKIKELPDLINVHTESKYCPSNDVIRFNNEITRALEQDRPDFKKITEMILHNAAARFLSCAYDDGEATDAFKNDIVVNIPNELSFEFLKKYVRKIIISEAGNITVIFNNNAMVAELEES